MEPLTPRLLITDDDDALRTSLAEVLQTRGFEVAEARDGREAMEILQITPVHLALVDVHMPRLSGIDLLRELDAARQRLPCILMSADLDQAIRDAAAQLRVYRVVDKPFRLAEITQTVRQGLADFYDWAC